MKTKNNLIPEISVIIPYQSKKHIKECLDSLQSQIYKNFEIIIIYPSSRNQIPSIFQHYLNKHHNFSIIQEKSDVLTLQNKAVMMAQGKFIYFLNSENLITPNCLSVLYYMITTTQNRLISSEIMAFGQNMTKMIQPRLNKFEMYGLAKCDIFSALFYKEDFVKFGGFKVALKNDKSAFLDYLLNYIDSNIPIKRIPKTLLLYRTPQILKNYQENHIKILMKYYIFTNSTFTCWL